MITGLPTYGASMRKMILRFVGAALGGVLGLAAIIAVSPNFETIVTYMAVFFVALLPCAYLGLSSGRLAYPGKQAGVTFCPAVRRLVAQRQGVRSVMAVVGRLTRRDRGGRGVHRAVARVCGRIDGAADARRCWK